MCVYVRVRVFETIISMKISSKSKSLDTHLNSRSNSFFIPVILVNPHSDYLMFLLVLRYFIKHSNSPIGLKDRWLYKP